MNVFEEKRKKSKFYRDARFYYGTFNIELHIRNRITLFSWLNKGNLYAAFSDNLCRSALNLPCATYSSRKGKAVAMILTSK